MMTAYEGCTSWRTSLTTHIEKKLRSGGARGCETAQHAEEKNLVPAVCYQRPSQVISRQVIICKTFCSWLHLCHVGTSKELTAFACCCDCVWPVKLLCSGNFSICSCSLESPPAWIDLLGREIWKHKLSFEGCMENPCTLRELGVRPQC